MKSISHCAHWLAPLCLGLAACTTLPLPTAAPQTIPDAFPASAVDAAATTLALPDWQTLFADARLRALIEAALDHNRDLRVAVARVAEVQAQYAIQQATALPDVHIGAMGERGRTPADLSVTRQPMIASQYRAGVLLAAYEIDFWGRVRSLNDAALAQYLATDEARRAFQLGLIAQVAQSYLLSRELAERLELATQALENRQEFFRIMGRRAAVGSVSDFELRQAESALRAAEGERAALQRQQQQNEALLDQLSGYARPALPTAAPLAAQGLEAPLPAGLPSALLLNRPDLRAAERRLEASHARVHAARAAFLPNITLTAFGGAASAELENLFHSGSSAWNFIPVVHLPLFDGGRTRAALSLAEARQHTAVADYEAAIQTAFREVSEALLAQRWLAEQIAAQQALVRSESERARLAWLRFDRGRSSYLDVLDAQRAQFAAEQALVQLRRSQMSNTVNLYKSLGGGRLD